MGWYKTGSVAVANGSATVTGTGTAWVSGARVGQAFALEGAAASYEIVEVVSNTELTISPAYLGSTQAGQAYAIMPVVGFYREAYDALAEAVAQWSDFVGSALSGLFKDGTAAAPGLAFEDETATGFFRKEAGQIGIATGGTQRALLSSAAFKIDVPLTGSAVQSGATDATAGRALLTGAFGLGVDAGPQVTDLDAWQAAGFSHSYGGAHGSAPAGDNPFPSLAGAFGMLTGGATLGDPGQYLWQIAIQYGAAAPVMKYRNRAASAWGDWFELYSSFNLIGTVGQSGGVPTGAVIERGSNANGAYVRFADGTQICDLRATSSAAGAQSWTFPAAFVSAPQVAATCNQDLARIVTTSAGGLTSTSFSVWNTAQTRVVADASLIAVGRWF